MNKITMGSVFSGIGGEMVAATMIGWEVDFFCEKNDFCNKVLSFWYPYAKNYEDITKTNFGEWHGKVDVLTGGFPCQPFSYAGKRRGAEDDRYLWPHMFRCIDEVQPTWVVAENVAGILTMVEQGEVVKVGGQTSLFAEDNAVQRYELRETFTLQRICTDLESHGYAVQPVLVPACAVGAPHRRDRVFIVARRIDAPYPNGTRARDNDGATCDEGRTACEDWRESLRQGHGQTGTSGAISASDDDATIPQDSMHSRQLHGQDEVEGSERNIGNVGAGGSERLCGEESGLEDTDIQGRPIRRSSESSSQYGRGRSAEYTSGRRDEMPNDAPRTTTNERRGSGYACRHATDTDSEGLERHGGQELQGHQGRQRADEYIASSNQFADEVGRRWRGFPSVSPVHRGNDGLPFDVDRLTLSFGKWRTESLKAYGNAIVPQVLYEIFRAIEIAEHERR